MIRVLSPYAVSTPRCPRGFLQRSMYQADFFITSKCTFVAQVAPEVSSNYALVLGLGFGNRGPKVILSLSEPFQRVV